MLRPPSAQRLPLLAIAALFLLLVSLRLHGYSLAAWHTLVDGSPTPEVLLGQPRTIRSDDWLVILPLAFAQLAHEPPFPVHNRTIGLGQNMLVPFTTPVAHPLTLLRPSTWGFFLGRDVGMAWMWWSHLLGLFTVWFLVLRVVTGGRLGLALLGGLGVATAPFFQFWSLRPAPVAAFAGLVFLAAHGLLRARRPLALLAHGVLLGWAGAAFGLELYPPFQVPLAQLVLALGVGTLWAERAGLEPRRALGWRLAALGLAGALAGGSLVWLLADAGDAVARLRGSVFPGARISTGGDRPLAELFASQLGLPLAVHDFGPLHNVCEAASFWLVSPALAAALLWRWARRGRAPDAVEAALLVYVGALFAYCSVGFPEWLARATLLSQAPGQRAVIGLGIADALLLARFLSQRTAEAPAAARVPRPVALAIAAAWALLLAACARHLALQVDGFPLALGAAFAAGNGLLALAALRARRPLLPAAGFAAAGLLAAVWFNPLVQGGGRYVLENPLSQRILALDREAGGASVWLAFGDPDVSNLFRMLGVRALNGVHPVPQLELWRALDPTGRFLGITNRYAHPAFVAEPRADVGFRLRSQDTIVVNLDPRNPVLRSLGVSHVLIRLDERETFERLTGFEHVGSVGRNQLYRLPPD